MNESREGTSETSTRRIPTGSHQVQGETKYLDVATLDAVYRIAY